LLGVRFEIEEKQERKLDAIIKDEEDGGGM